MLNWRSITLNDVHTYSQLRTTRLISAIVRFACLNGYNCTCVLAARESRFKMVTQGSRCVGRCWVRLSREWRCAEDTDQSFARLVTDLVWWVMGYSISTTTPIMTTTYIQLQQQEAKLRKNRNLIKVWQSHAWVLHSTPYARTCDRDQVVNTGKLQIRARSTSYFRSVVEHEMEQRTVCLLGGGVCPCARLLNNQQRSNAL